ncbi:PREDICTED: uncharacterized protein LOC107071962 [Polistes dominula]|uniref:Uncharacterized protein LOC107071962 n=1 Tax=Polistes dominula TaxID=743375 RepID=A0ABM1J3B6_POLDO|nr:PREDICTED: uncharacterized protein LOC107071962 [Polistes dominula]
MCKILEKIINKRLRWLIETKKTLNPHQSLRNFRSTLDHRSNLETNVCDALINKEHVIMISIDIEKAYDMVWRDKVMEIVGEFIGGNMLQFIKNFFKDRYIQVKINGHLLKKVKTENGIPQDSIISVTLFLLEINYITKQINPPIKSFLFVDDLTICCKGKNIKTTAELLQSVLNSLQEWSNGNGLKCLKLNASFLVKEITSEHQKSPEMTLEYRAKFHELLEEINDYIHIYTDASKTEGKSGIAVILPEKQSKYSIYNYTSIFTGEAYAIYSALEHIEESNNTKFAIFSDSMSVLSAIGNKKLENDIIKNIIDKFTIINSKLNKEILMIWLPAYQGIPGNEKADKAAKEATNLQGIENSLPPTHTDLKKSYFRIIKTYWEELWSNSVPEKLRPIVDTFYEKENKPPNLCRKDCTVINRLKIGHTIYTHSYLFDGMPKPKCETCNETISVKHLLVDCPNYINTRIKYRIPCDLKTALTLTEHHKNVINFLKTIKMYEHI